MYKRMCKDCPRRQKSLTKSKYYCQGKKIFFGDENHYCYTKHKVSSMKKYFKRSGDYGNTGNER